MKEILDNNKGQENVIARSESGSVLEVVKPGEKRKLSPEEKAKIPQEIIKAEEKYKNEIARIEANYAAKVTKENIDNQVREIGLKRAKESYDSRIKFLNNLN